MTKSTEIGRDGDQNQADQICAKLADKRQAQKLSVVEE